jgi:pimeloyl-ACP methyl ester carboxylesterase
MAEHAQIGDVRLAYDRTGGNGAPVVFLHGLGGRKEAWGEVVAAAAQAGFDSIALDLRGAGESDKPPGPYSVQQWAGDLIAFLEALGIQRAALVGHSVGCMVGEHAALALQDRCTALAMLGGALRWPQGFEEVLTGRAELARAGRMREIAEAVAASGLSQRALVERPELVERFLTMFESNDPDGYAESALATAGGMMLDPDRVPCHALAFSGAEDAVAPSGVTKEIAASMPRGEFGTVPGGAHWCQMEVPGAVSEQLLAFLRRAAIG